MKVDLSAILNKAFKITKESKWLWVWGILLAGSASFNFSRAFNSNKRVDSFSQNTENAFLTTLQGYVRFIPPYYFVILGVLVVLFVILAICISLYLRSFAEGALIYGISLENANTKALLSNTAKKGRAVAIEVIKLNVFPSLLLGLAFFVAFVPLVGIAAIVPDNNIPLRLIIVLVTIVFLIAFVIAAIFVSVSLNIGRMSVVLEGLSWKEGLKKGFDIFKKYFTDVIVLGFLNCLISIAVWFLSCVVFIPVIFLGLAGVFGIMALPVLSIIFIPLGVILFITVMLGFSLLGGMFTVFNNATWVLLYEQLTEGGLTHDK